MGRLYMSVPVRAVSTQECMCCAVDLNMDTCKTRLQVWAEWESDTSDSVLRIRAEWKRDIRLVINLRLRGLTDSHPWKQMYAIKSEATHRTYSVDDFIGSGSCVARFEMREGTTYTQFLRACVDTRRVMGMLSPSTSGEPEAACGESHVVAVVLDVRHVRDDAYLVGNSNAFRGLLSSRIRTLASPDGCDSVYVLESQGKRCEEYEVIVGGTEDSPDGARISTNVLQDSHMVRVRNHAELRVTNSDGDRVTDEFMCRIMRLYNHMQDIEFEEEVISVSYATNASFEEVFQKMRELYRVCLYNDMEWLRMMVTLYLLNKYRHSPLLCDLYQFYHELKEVGVRVSFEERVLNASVQKLFKSTKDVDVVLADMFIEKCTRGMQPWQSHLWRTFICDSKKRPRDYV